MKHTLNKKSWHFWVANNFGGLNYFYVDTTDLCSYIRNVFAGLFNLTLAASAAFVIVFIYLVGGYEYFSCIFNPSCTEFSDVVYVFYSFNALIGFLGLLISYALLKDYMYEYNEKHKKTLACSKKNAKPSFVTLAYRKFKEKTCVKIDFE